MAAAGQGTADLRMEVRKQGRRASLLAWEVENNFSVPEPVSDALAQKLDIHTVHCGHSCAGLVAVLARAGPCPLVSHRLPQTPIST